MISRTPKPPYYAVIFTSLFADSLCPEEEKKKEKDYDDMALKMFALAEEQPGFLGVESARQGLGVTVSYWTDLESIRKWKANEAHMEAQKKGRDLWYKSYKTRIAKVERDYESIK